MHIAVVCRGLGAGGSVAVVALRQARELTRHARVTMISDSLPADAHGIELIRVHVRDLRVLRRFRHVPDELLFDRAARRALRTLSSLDFVLCHSHAAAYFAARPLGVPFGFFVHGDISDRPKGTYDARLTAFYRWVTPRAYRTANVVFVLAQSFVPLAERGGATHVEVIPNGIAPAEIGAGSELQSFSRAATEIGAGSELQSFSRAATEIGAGSELQSFSRAATEIGAGSELQSFSRAAEEPLRVLYVGRLSVEKGLDHLLDAFDLLLGAEGRAHGATRRGQETEGQVTAGSSPAPRAQRPAPQTPTYELTIAGGGPLEAHIRARLTERTHFLGRVPRGELGALYARHHLLCTPALSEPFGLVVLEALISGLPVVGTRVGGIPELVEDGRTGLLVPPGDARALADALAMLERDEPLRASMAANARASVLPRFAWDRIGDRIADAIRRVIAR